jgi:hypothetical protein
MEEVLVPLGLFAIIPVIVGVVTFNRRKASEAMGRVLETMVAKGDVPTPETIKALGVRQRPQHADLRTGLVLIAIAIAMILCGGTIPDKDGQAVLGGLAMFPLLVGIVYTGLWFAIGRKAD